MKKLLATLGTITIAGTGISGVVGNAPVSMKVEINSLQKNNLEKLNRNKRYIGDNTMLPDDTININVRPISQSERLSCGPAVATSILRHFGLSSEEYRNGISFVSESRLIRNMETDDGSVYSMLPGEEQQ